MSKMPLHGSQTKSSVKSENCKTRLGQIRNICTQTSNEKLCEDHNEKITELLSEVAVTLSQKATLEKEISDLKYANADKETKFNTKQKKLEHEILNLKSYNYEKELELSKLKISHLEEQRNLLKQISELKSQLQKANREKESLYQKFQSEKHVLENKIENNNAQIQAESQKNAILLTKLTKYKNKLKLQTVVLKKIAEEQEQQRQQEEQREIKNEVIYVEDSQCVTKEKYEPNVEEMVLSELFFKPRPIPSDISSLFFRKQMC